VSRTYDVYLSGDCFYVDIGGKSVPLSLAPWSFGTSYCSVCAYPRRHRYHVERREVVRCRVGGKELREVYEVPYVATFAPGIYYGDFYRAAGVKLGELYSYCRDFEVLLRYLTSVRPRVNLLSVLILCCKKAKNSVFFDILGKALAKAIITHLHNLDPSGTVVTYVPRHPGEYKVDMFTGERYNQAELLAQVVARELGLNPPIEAVCVRAPMGGRSQRKLSRCERYKSAVQAYDLIGDAEDLIRGRTVILVDDVRTSGATAWSISRLLTAAGAEKVYIAVAGRSVLRNDFDIFIGWELSRCRPPWL